MNYKSRLTRISRLCLPPLYYRMRKRLISKRRPYAPKNSMLENLEHSSFANLICDQADSKMLWREFCDLLMSEAGSASPDSPSFHDKGIAGELTRFGCCRMREYFPRQLVASLGRRFYADHINPKSALQQFAEYNAQGKINRYHVPLDLYPELKEILKNPEMAEEVSKYLGKPASLYEQFYLEVKTESVANDETSIPHFDSCFKSVKYFIPLADITIENAPFVYFPKTHLFHEWRLLRDFLLYSSYNSVWHQTFSYLSPNEVTKLTDSLPQFTSNPVKMTAEAGDLLVADTRGIHSGSYLSHGERLLLIINNPGICYYDDNDPVKHSVKNSVAFA